MSTPTFLWHDYETFGANPRRDRPAQFAAIRTDAELNEIGEPRSAATWAMRAAQHKVATPKKLEGFDLEGYAFAPAASEPDRLVFRRKR